MRPVQMPLIAPTFSLPVALLEPKGVVYTRRWVVELILDLAGYTINRDLVTAVAVEPSAGDGAFLVPMVERLVDSCLGQGKPLSSTFASMVAYELDEGASSRARELVTTCLVQRGIEPFLAEDLAASWVRTGDYLLRAHELSADFVLGNPPYIRLEEIPQETARYYRSCYPSMVGRADLYVAFFEAALRQLKPGGRCAFICADRWMRNQYGSELRQLVTNAFSVDVVIEMHEANAFHEEVDAYPAITVIRRGPQGPVLVARAREGADSVAAREILSALQLTGGDSPHQGSGTLEVARVDTWFTGADPWPCQSPDQLAMLRLLESCFEPLERTAKIGIGVATGNDQLFIVTDPELVEESRMLKLALVKDIAGGTLRWSGHYLVDPWNCEGLVDLGKFPRLRKYFYDNAIELKKRHTATKNAHGWYRTIDRVNHGLSQKPKLYIADIKNRLEPVLDRGETYPHHNLYFIQSDKWDLEVLGGLLISAFGQFFVESYGVRMRGGYLRFQAQYLRRIRVPSPSALDEAQRAQLRRAFRDRDRGFATELALQIYGVSADQMERALGH
jgi:adenine-specific DNA-methyltransferase